MAKEARLSGDELFGLIEQQHQKSDIPPFRAGDTLKVGVRIREGAKERIQVFTGVCIARKGGGNRATFTVRRVVQGEGVERVFPLHSPNIDSIKVERRGRARRAKLHYLRDRRGRAARLKEDRRLRPEDKAKE